ncbi:MAG: penicillin acylase family protein, partial [Pseudomonadales bacterium]
DHLGVPHVYGETDADAAFGLAYAQGEDHWRLIEEQIPFYRGTNARYNGPDAAVTDYLVKLLRIWPTIEAKYETELDVQTRRYVQAFADGLNYYAAMHPDQVTHPDILPVTGHDIVAGNMLRHLLFYGFEGAIRELGGPVRARGISGRGVAGGLDESEVVVDGVPVGSNAFAVAPHYTDDGATRLAINSHQPTTGPVAWYEAHIRSKEGLNMMGGLFPGSSSISVGFNETLAWAATVNKPDLVDIYVLEIDPQDPDKYRLDGQWVNLDVGEVEIEVTLWGWLPWSVSREVLYSRHGPVLRTDHGTYAIRYAGHGEMRQAQQWYRLDKATSVAEWLEVMGMASFASFNFVAADATGNIAFVHNSLTPDREPGYDWTQYLPGDDSSLIWQSYLPFGRLPQVINPKAGFVHSANQTPFRVTKADGNPQPGDFPVAAGFQTRMTNRAWRGLELLESLAPISAEDFFAIKHDKFYSNRSRPAGWVRQALELDLSGTELENAQSVLGSWDLGTDVDNPGAALGVCFVATDWKEKGPVLEVGEIHSALKRCSELLLSNFATLNPPWGEVNRHVRGEVNVPIGGGPDILRAVYGRGLEENG